MAGGLVRRSAPAWSPGTMGMVQEHGLAGWVLAPTQTNARRFGLAAGCGGSTGRHLHRFMTESARLSPFISFPYLSFLWGGPGSGGMPRRRTVRLTIP